MKKNEKTNEKKKNKKKNEKKKNEKMRRRKNKIFYLATHILSTVIWRLWTIEIIREETTAAAT